MARRYSRSRSRYAPHNPDIASPTAKNAPPIAFLVKLAHDIPHMPTLESLRNEELAAYTPVFKGPSVQSHENAIVMATIARGKLVLSNVPASISAYQGIISYHRLITSRNITVLTRIHAFTIYTTPYDNYARAIAFLNASMLPDALLEFDNAITQASACIEMEDITDTLERSFSRYCKLRNMFMHNTEEHESKLALERALTEAVKLWNVLSHSATG